MSAFRFLVWTVVLVVCASIVVFAPAVAAAGKPVASSTGETMSFDIPSQPLEDALYAFGAATGIEVFVDGGAVAGRRSTEIKGDLTATQALLVLLTGTGLDAHPIGARAITLSLHPQVPSGAAVYRNYSAILQNAVLRRLCGENDGHFGTYRIAMQLWLNEIGSVEHVELLSSTGDEVRDHRLRERLEGLSVVKPPHMLPQPVIIVILPRSSRDSGDCTANGGDPIRFNVGGDRPREP